MATTGLNSLRYTDSSDGTDLNLSMKELADDCDVLLVSRHTSTTTRDSVITSPVNGQICYVSDAAVGANNRCLNVYNGSTWAPFYRAPLFAYKTAAESVTSSNVLQDDDHLTLALTTNATFKLKIWLSMTGSDAGDFQYTLAYPAGTSVANGSFGYSTTSTAGTPRPAAIANTGLDATTPTTALALGTHAGVITNLLIIGILTVGSTAGNLLLRWAQNVSDGTATQLKIGSYMMLTRVT